MSARSGDPQRSSPAAAGRCRGAAVAWDDLPLLLTQREAAELLHCSLSHLRIMIDEHIIPQVRLSPRVLRISRLALQELVERGGPATS
jgi:excisionase family DNA binding protein